MRDCRLRDEEKMKYTRNCMSSFLRDGSQDRAKEEMLIYESDEQMSIEDFLEE